MESHRQGAFENLTGSAAALPWWLGLLLALASYVGFHALAGMTVQAAEQPTAQVYIKTLATALQYLLPVVLVVAAALSVVGRKRRAAQLAARPAAGEHRPGADRPRRAPVKRTGTSTYMACPKCGSMMVQRVSDEGANAGKTYWGCSRFPLCKETQTIP